MQPLHPDAALNIIINALMIILYCISPLILYYKSNTLKLLQTECAGQDIFHTILVFFPCSRLKQVFRKGIFLPINLFSSSLPCRIAISNFPSLSFFKKHNLHLRFLLYYSGGLFYIIRVLIINMDLGHFYVKHLRKLFTKLISTSFIFKVLPDI